MRIVYIHLANPQIAGGQKMALRHVETLNELGFEAVCMADRGVELPTWFEHHAAVVRGGPVGPEDVIVVPEDGTQALSAVFASPARRIVVLCQNPYYLGATNLDGIAQRLDRVSAFLTVAPRQAALMARMLPGPTVVRVRCFADERRFRPAEKRPVVAYAPRKRRLEAAAIRAFHRRLRPDHVLDWSAIDNVGEDRVAAALGSAGVYLSLSRLESVGMTTLEAMASGCVCAGFTGVGGAEYATAGNGFWAPEDDCLAAAEALAAAIDLTRAGGPKLAAMLDAARETARAWSYAVFRRELEEAWMRLAPEARRRGA